MTTDSELEKRLPPHDANAERSVLGSILRNNMAYTEIAAKLRKTDFYSFANQCCWSAVEKLQSIGKPADPVTVADEIERTGHLADIGGYAYIVDLWDGSPSAANAKYHADIIRKKSSLRELIHACGEIQANAFHAEASPDELLAAAETAIFNISQHGQADDVVHISDAIRRALETMDRRSGKSADGEVEESLRTTWSRFDTMTGGGIHKRSLTILAARPSVGKTIMAGNVISHVARNSSSTFFASVEQSIVEIVNRWFAMLAQVNGFKFLTGNLNDMETDRVLQAARDLETRRLWINDRSSQSAHSIASHARRIKMRHGLDLVVVDYLQIVKAENHRASRNDQVGEISWKLKQMAKDLDVAVLCLAQLNRNIDSRGGDEPRLSDLRDSGNIEQDADTVIFMHKPDPPDQARDVDVVKFLIRKQRNGPLGDVTMLHHKKFFELREPAHGAIP